MNISGKTVAAVLLAASLAVTRVSAQTISYSVKDLEGNVIMEQESGALHVPASNLKLVTTGCALHKLGSSYHFTTTLSTDGTIEDGILKGNLYIVGGCDPCVGESYFPHWLDILRKAGIGAIDGDIVGDGGAWPWEIGAGSWSYEDSGTYYGCGADALCFYKNTIDFAVEPSQTGTPVSITQLYPQTPWLNFQNRSVTGPEGSGNSLYLFTTDLAPYSRMSGSYAVDKKPKTEHFANKYGALTCAYYFYTFLRNSGMDVSGMYTDGHADGGLKTIGTYPSAPLAAIVRETNLNSDNFFAEAIFRATGRTATAWQPADSCIAAEHRILKDLLGYAPDIKIADGCGLSRENLLSTDFMTDFLLAITASPAFRPFLASLPKPGEGTLYNLVASKRFVLKSGSMGGVLCYSGYILDNLGAPVATVSIMLCGSTASQNTLRKTLEPLLSKILAATPTRQNNL